MPTIPSNTRFLGDETPMQIWWLRNGSLLNFSSGYTFRARLSRIATPTTVIWEKTTGFTGSAGSGTQANGTPNLSITFDASSADWNDSSLTAGDYLFQIKALKTSDNTEETMEIHVSLRSRLW